MDVFKLAFETTIVGLLTFGWLGVATHLLFPDFQLDSIRQKFPDFVKNNPTAIGVGFLILAYCLGSAILPIANQLVNDEHWPLNENAIRCQVFTKQQSQLEHINDTALPKDKGFSLTNLEPVHCSYWAPVFYAHGKEKDDLAIRRFLRLWFPFPGDVGVTAEVRCDPKTTESDGCKRKKILALFQQQETAILNLGSDKTERIRQLHERIVVLRGLVFSLFILFLICLCAYFAKVNGHRSHWFRPAFGILLALGFTAFAILNGYQDLLNRDIFDIPVLESLLAVISVFGVVVVCRGAKTQQFMTKRYVLVAFFFTGLAYGGWMWSEIIYDQQIISSFAVLQNSPETTSIEHVVFGSESRMCPP